jgi:3-deoxy-manno-octulosonate cytidylyltransferase (CMP-KDO synthetase)
LSFKVYIPARFASTRLPGKPLLDIAGKPLIRHVYERAIESGAEAVVIATDDERIRECAVGFGAAVCMTSSEHPSGTDRIAEAVGMLKEPDDTVVVNLQGDEPTLPPSLIRQAARLLEEAPGHEMATLCAPIAEPDTLFDPNVVKVVFDQDRNALYFSRAPIPWDRDGFTKGGQTTVFWGDTSNFSSNGQENRGLSPFSGYRHIGLYAYRVGFLKRFPSLPPCPMEQTEKLEQLRALYYGYRIKIAVAEMPSGAGVDTPADLERVRVSLQGYTVPPEENTPTSTP